MTVLDFMSQPSQQQQELSLYDIYLEAATRLFTNMQFLSSTVEDHVKANMERNPQHYTEKNRPQMERKNAMDILNLFREISKKNDRNIVQAIVLHKPDSMSRGQFANYVSSAVALPLVKANTHDLTKWYDMGMPKALYEITNPETFLKIEKICYDNDIPYHIVEDNFQNMKAMGIGPFHIEGINRIVGNLKRI